MLLEDGELRTGALGESKVRWWQAQLFDPSYCDEILL